MSKQRARSSRRIHLTRKCLKLWWQGMSFAFCSWSCRIYVVYIADFSLSLHWWLSSLANTVDCSRVQIWEGADTSHSESSQWRACPCFAHSSIAPYSQLVLFLVWCWDANEFVHWQVQKLKLDIETWVLKSGGPDLAIFWIDTIDCWHYWFFVFYFAQCNAWA